ALPESVRDATVAEWRKRPGENVKKNENLLDLETDKVVLEVPAPVDGVLQEIRHETGDKVRGGDVLALIAPGSIAAQAASVAPSAEEPLSPSARRKALEGSETAAPAPSGVSPAKAAPDLSPPTPPAAEAAPHAVPVANQHRTVQRVPMTRLRARVAERLMQAQHDTATLTTFNEVDLQRIVDLRNQYKATFEKEHGIKLGIMSFFIKATVEALKRYPAANASIDGEDILYHNYYDIGIAVSTARGLVVPILRDADRMTFATIERTIVEYSQKARESKLSLDDLTGGTFSITNGGIFGSMLSTPILNPPQSAILGMHAIKERPVAENGQVVIRPMMYLALSYDHRLIDGRDAVKFLFAIKELLEDPARLLLHL
ncbi:MAG TPA: dihydrolipoyllysine-residue succinyltransferase, partial [Methylococcaceae bacterium]|nr:dihydrolipoyllysine-residue succinyltransferase [Methylococcaceae bacterium]